MAAEAGWKGSSWGLTGGRGLRLATRPRSNRTGIMGGESCSEVMGGKSLVPCHACACLESHGRGYLGISSP